MYLSKFSFNVPKSLIAFYPSYMRSDCRLLIVNGNTGKMHHKFFFHVLHEINSGDLIIFNDTEVMPARLFGYKDSGGKIEALLERILTNNSALARIKSSNPIQVNSRIYFGSNNVIQAHVENYKKPFYKIVFSNRSHSIIDILNDIGNIPLPLYIKRKNHKLDINLYQTVYKKHLGSIAAPTAGLHFDWDLLDALCKKGVNIDYITLHIGSGTFQPVLTSMIKEHVMHSEFVNIPKKVIKKIKLCKKNGNRIIAVGTTTLRALESVYHSLSWNQEKDYTQETNIFIYPGYKHNVVDALITNFHFPESTLVMLVSSFLGYKNTMNAYHKAIKEKYRFFTYGDAMYITYNTFAPYEKY